MGETKKTVERGGDKEPKKKKKEGKT